jgi:hypothetical protein
MTEEVGIAEDRRKKKLDRVRVRVFARRSQAVESPASLVTEGLGPQAEQRE